jgi:hypothetical protein
MSAAGRAGAILSGLQRVLEDQGFYALSEFTLANGRRADAIAIGPDGDIAIVEVKSGLADYLSDRKWQDYRAYCDRFYFAVDPDFPAERLPVSAGLIVADAFGGVILREAEPARLHPARRRALTLQFARSAAARLMAQSGLSRRDG